MDGSIQQDMLIGISKQQESLSDFEPRIPLEIPSALLALELMKTGEIMRLWGIKLDVMHAMESLQEGKALMTLVLSEWMMISTFL